MAVPLGVAGIAAGVVAITVASFVLVKGRRTRTTRWLAALLVVEAVAQVTVAIPFFAPSERQLQVTLYIGHVIAAIVEPAIYLGILASLDSFLQRPLRNVWVWRGIALVTLGELALFALRPGWFYYGLPDMYAATHGGHVEVGVFVLYALVSLTGLLAIAASIHAYRRSKAGSLPRSRAVAFLTAFGTRDGLFTILLLAYPYVYVTDLFFTFPFQVVYYVVAPLVTAGFGALVAYGILKTQLFDIDLRVKQGLRRGLVAATLLLLVLTAIYVAKSFVDRQFGIVAGAAGTSLIILLLPGIRKASEKATNALMPGVNNSPEYVAYRKLEVYRLAVETARESGDLEKSRHLLALLQAELHIRPDDAQAVEEDALRRRASATT